MCRTNGIEGQTINIGNSKEISIQDLVNKIKELMNSNIEIVSSTNRLRPESSEVNRLCADIKKAFDLLNWKPKFSLTEGLKATIKWFSEDHNLKKYKLMYNL